MRRIKLVYLLIALVLPSSGFASSAEAVDLLNKMNDAQQQLEYSGRLVFIKDGEPSILFIEQKIENGIRKETIVPLDEKAGYAAKETSSLSLNSFSPITPEMQDIYSFDLGEKDQVAGRPCQIITARPKDRKRYLQKYCVDLEKNILLEYSLTNLERQPVERFMFTDFKVSDQHMGNTRVPASISLADNQTTEVMSTMPTMSVAQKGQSHYSKWIFDSLPVGFRRVQLSVEEATQNQNNNQEEEHLIVTDGLSSVSVFIAKDGGRKADSTHSVMNSGALNILTKFQSDYTVTLVGEVPKGTLQDIYSGLRITH
jgi:sigma-E factor negative regulatory protein RseB